MRKRSGQVHSRESSATLQLTVSLLYQNPLNLCTEEAFCDSIKRRMEDGGSRGAPIGSGKCTRKKEEEVV